MANQAFALHNSIVVYFAIILFCLFDYLVAFIRTAFHPQRLGQRQLKYSKN